MEFSRYNRKEKSRIKQVVTYITSGENIYTMILLLIIILICFENGFGKATTVDFYPINGDFQNYNVWRRLLDGQIPFKDFPVYLGTGHLLLGSFFTGLLGNTFKISLFVSYALTMAISAGIITIISYLILKKLNRALATTVMILVLNKERFPWILNVNYSEFWPGLDATLTPGNSARIIRSGVVILIIGGVLLSMYIIDKRAYHYKKESSKFLIQSTCVAAISGLGILYSNDIGISSYICFSFVYFLLLLKKYKLRNIKKIVKYTLFYIIISLIAFIIGIILITRGNIGSWFEFTFATSQYQSWYYGCEESWKTYFISQLAFSPLGYTAILIVILNIYKLFTIKIEEAKDTIHRGLIIYVLLTGFVAAYMYRIVSGGIATELMSLSSLAVIISYVIKYILIFFTRMDDSIKDFTYIIKLSIIIFSISFTFPRFYNTYSLYSNNQNGVYVSGLDGNLTKLSDDINTIIEYTGDEKIFSTYASAVETIKGDFQPTGTDYIIHVFGDKARKNYVRKFLEGNYKFVQTINRDFENWELWAESSNWFFYKELYKHYTPKLTTSYSVIWEPVEKENVIDSSINVNVEKLSESEYKITCTSDKKINALVDVLISYSSYFSNGFLNKGVYGKYVHITDTTRNNMYKTYHTNYFIPGKSSGYNIPITLQDGIGEIVVSTYPLKNTSLTINSVKANEVIKMPFGFQTFNQNDEYWSAGVNKTLNTILFKNNNFNNYQLEGATALKSGDVVAEIESVQLIDDWIHVTIKGNKEAFSYPNNIEVIKE